MKNPLIVLFFAVAILAASISVFFVMQDRREVAQANAAKAQELATAQIAEKATAEAMLQTEKTRVAAIEAERAKVAEEKAAAEQREKAAAAELEVEESKRKQAEVAAETERERAKAAAEARAEAEAKQKTAKFEKEKSVADQKKAEAEAQRAEELRLKAESEALKVRNSLAELELARAHYEELARETQSVRAELEAMRQALAPEKTVNDLITVGEEKKKATQSDLDEAELVKEMGVTPAQRQLDRVEDRRDKEHASALDRRRSETIAAYEQLLESARADGRVIDMRYYYNILKALYPGWKYTKKTEGKK